MHTTRRSFLKKTTFTVAGAALFSRGLFAANKAADTVLGIQLYSVRDDMKTDALGTLKQIAAIGYKNVEHANYSNRKFYGYTVAEFKKILSDLGLQMPSGHSVLSSEHWDESKNDFTDTWKQTIEDSAAVGQQYVISPWMDEDVRKNPDNLKQFLDVFNKCGELCKKSGVKFGYHNHDFEFNETVNNMTLYDAILQNTNPELVAQQIDIGNMVGGGGKALDVIKKYPGRFELMHVKDEIKAAQGAGEMGGYESTILGKGVVGVKEVLDLAKASGGTIHFIVEQETYQGKTPIDSVREDFEIMKQWGY